MKTTMLEYFKIILEKVSFDRRLFRKEYRKSISHLPRSEAEQLKAWLKSRGLALASERVKPKT